MFRSKTTSDSRLVLAVLKGRWEDFGVLVLRYLPAVRAVESIWRERGNEHTIFGSTGKILEYAAHAADSAFW